MIEMIETNETKKAMIEHHNPEIQRILELYQPGAKVKIRLELYLEMSHISLMFGCLIEEGVTKLLEFKRANERLWKKERDWLEEAMRSVEGNERGE